LNWDKKDEFSVNTEIKNVEIFKILKVSEKAIDRVKKKIIEDDEFESVLKRRPSIQNYSKKIDGDFEAKIVANCCNTYPEGFFKMVTEANSRQDG
jgi:hypothetical protein